MVDLGNATVPLNPQVMDDRPVWRILEMEIDVVRRLLFSLQTGAGDGQFLIGAPPLLAWRGVAYGACSKYWSWSSRESFCLKIICIDRTNSCA